MQLAIRKCRLALGNNQSLLKGSVGNETEALANIKPSPSGHGTRNTKVSLVRSSAAEYLTFVAAGGESDTSVEMRYEDENVWLTQKMMEGLYGVSVPAINQHM
jgi:hypothetical protein